VARRSAPCEQTEKRDRSNFDEKRDRSNFDRQIRKPADRTREGGVTLIPLKVYFVSGRVKVLVGVARGKRRADKRQELSRREAKREIDRAISRRMP